MQDTIDLLKNKSQDKLLMLDFFATWCKPCDGQGKIIDELAQEFDKICFKKIDVDKNEELVKNFKIMGVPTLIAYKSGVEVWREAGVVSKIKLKTIIEDFGI